MNPEATLEQFGFTGPNIGGVVFFDADGGNFVGAVFEQGAYDKALARAKTRGTGEHPGEAVLAMRRA